MPRVPHTGVVLSAEHLTPHMVRVVLGGDGLAAFEAGTFTDHYVKLQIAGKTPHLLRQRLGPGARELTIDFVVHGDTGDTGVAGPWAAAARAGDTLEFMGPGGAYAPDPDADWHLMAGDASVTPATAASLARVPAGVPVFVVLEVDGPGEEQPLSTPGDLRLQWVHRSRGPGEEPELLVDAVRALELPGGRGQAFVHGEASSVRALRRHLLVERAMTTEAVSATGYWKLRRTEEGWREDKPEWQRLAAADVA